MSEDLGTRKLIEVAEAGHSYGVFAAAVDIPKFVPKVDLQADYSTAKVRVAPGGRACVAQGWEV